MADQRPDRLVQGDRVAEVADHGARDELEVLLRQGTIEPELQAHLGHGRRGRARAQHLLDRVARHQVDDQKRRDRQPDQNRYGREYSTYEVEPRYQVQ